MSTWDAAVPPTFYSPIPAFLVIAGILFALCLYLYRRERHGEGGPRKVATLLVLTVLFGAATGGLAYLSYLEAVQMNTWTYFYEMDVQPTSTAPQSVIVPIPQDPSLLADLHVASGAANWSLVDTIHGRGLYVQFHGQTTVEALFSELWSNGSGHNVTLTMMNSPASGSWGPAWVFCGGSGGVTLHFQPGGVGSNGSPVLAAGWNLVELTPHP